MPSTLGCNQHTAIRIIGRSSFAFSNWLCEGQASISEGANTHAWIYALHPHGTVIQVGRAGSVPVIEIPSRLALNRMLMGVRPVFLTIAARSIVLASSISSRWDAKLDSLVFGVVVIIVWI